MRQTYAIGDIHGRADLLSALLQAIASHADRIGARRPLLVFLGDYIDRGPDSKAVLDLVIDGLPGFDVVRLKGNHEDMMAAYVFGGDPRMANCWLMNGGIETLRSYGVTSNDEISDVVAAIPAPHRDLLRAGLALSHREGEYLFVHAGIRPGVPIDRQRAMDLMWIRGEFLDSPDDHGVIVVHGHTPQERPVARHNRIGIDTGAVWTGRLTAVALGGHSPEFIVAAA